MQLLMACQGSVGSCLRQPLIGARRLMRRRSGAMAHDHNQTLFALFRERHTERDHLEDLITRKSIPIRGHGGKMRVKIVLSIERTSPLSARFVGESSDIITYS